MGGWDGYDGHGYKPAGPITMARGLVRFDAIREGWEMLRDNAGNYFAHTGNYFRLFDLSREFGAKPIRSPRHIRLRQGAFLSG